MMAQRIQSIPAVYWQGGTTGVYDRHIAAAIKKVVATEFGQSVEVFDTPTKKRWISDMRKLTMAFLAVHCHGITLKELAAEVGRSDHTTAVHALTSVSQINDEVLKGMYWHCRPLVIEAVAKQRNLSRS